MFYARPGIWSSTEQNAAHFARVNFHAATVRSTRRAFLDQESGREKEPGKLPDSFKIHLLKTVVKLQRLMAGSCDNVILLFLGQADELNSVTRYTDGEVSVLRLLRMSLCV